MTYSTGENNFYFYVADISGNGVTGLDISDFTFDGEIEGTGITPPLSAIDADNGFYYFPVNLNIEGNGFIQILPTDNTYSTTPEIYDLVVGTDESTLLQQILNYLTNPPLEGTVAAGVTYGTYSFRSKAGDDAIMILQLPSTITDYSTTFDTFKATITTSSNTSGGVLGDLTILDPPNGSTNATCTLLCPSSYTENIIEEGKTSKTLYFDLQGRTIADGYRTTLATGTITVTRQFTTG
jgi:hypothetical protein